VAIAAHPLRVANFHEKAHFVKADVAAPAWPSATAGALRAMLPSALSVSPLFGGSVHTMRSVFSGSTKVLQSS
jgi:di/tricarboxylate transporter